MNQQKIYIDYDRNSNRGVVEVTYPTKPATTEQQVLLSAFNKAGLNSSTPGGKWLADTEYQYTTLTFKVPNTEDITSFVDSIKDVIAKNSNFTVDDESLTEAVSNTAIESINDMLHGFLGKSVGINANLQNIVYDTKVDVEANEITIYAYNTVEATDNDTKQLKDVIKNITDELKKRGDIKTVKDTVKAKNFKIVVTLKDSAELLADRVTESTRAYIDKICEDRVEAKDDTADIEEIVDGTELEIFPAILPDKSLAVVLMNSIEVDNENFIEACSKIREDDLMHPDEDDDETLNDNFNVDDCVIIRAPESITAEKMFTWAETIGTALETVGFNVQLNMDEDTDVADFDKIAEPETDEPEVTTESESTSFNDKALSEYNKKYADFKSKKLSKSAWTAYCADVLTKLMQDNRDIFKRLKNK